jgi:3-hydroxyisobutyrate dehydrogenase-like beta-hydroxyacid dehydrogenase
MAKQRIGFIGLGVVGAPMAGHLLRGGHLLVVYNRTRSKMESLLARGAQPGTSCIVNYSNRKRHSASARKAAE